MGSRVTVALVVSGSLLGALAALLLLSGMPTYPKLQLFVAGVILVTWGIALGVHGRWKRIARMGALLLSGWALFLSVVFARSVP